MAEWYYVHDGAQAGPVSGTQLKALAADGTLGREDLVWNESLPEWTAAGRIRGLGFPASAAPTSAAAPRQSQQLRPRKNPPILPPMSTGPPRLTT